MTANSQHTQCFPLCRRIVERCRQQASCWIQPLPAQTSPARFTVASPRMRKTAWRGVCLCTQQSCKYSVCPHLLCQCRRIYPLYLHLSDFISVFLLGHPYSYSSPFPVIPVSLFPLLPRILPLRFPFLLRGHVG